MTETAKVAPISPRMSTAKFAPPARGSHTLLSSFVAKPGTAGRVVTAAELAENCGIGSATGLAWVSIHGQVFDITEFSRVHPGGEVIRLAAGRDCTCLVESYHPVDSIVKVEAALYSKAVHVGVLQCAETVDVTSPSPAKGYQRPDDAFFVDVRARVDAYIKSTGAATYHSTYEALGVFEALCTLAVYWYATWQVGYHGSWFWAAALGILTGRMGFLMHMGNHCAISRSPRLNKYIGWFMELAGSNSVIWGYEHQVAHHVDPNEIHKDNDCEIGNPLVRMHPLIPHEVSQQYQHITVPLAMTIGFFKWMISDFDHFIHKSVGNVRISIDANDWKVLLCFKVWWILCHLVLPVYYQGPWKAWWQLFLFMGIGAHYLENIFIVNHIQNGLVPPAGAHWSTKQILATANWCSGSVFWNWMSGGLCHQVEHHLFPALTQYWYPHISPIVRQTCADHGLPYDNFESFPAAWMSMWTYLRDVGQPGFVSKTGMKAAPALDPKVKAALNGKKYGKTF